MARLDSFLRLVADQQASDLHFHAASVPIIRHDGDLIPLPFRVLSEEETRRFLLEVLTLEQQEVLEAQQQVDFLYAIPDVGRFRGNVFRQNHGLGAVFRVIPSRAPGLDELMLPPAAKSLTELQNGLVLVTGPTGSGKSTTLAAMVQQINRTSARHIITIEDPIEFVHEPERSVITQREVGRHAESFAAGLRSALREAPDVVVVGEMRDQETAQLALAAAETGVLVFGTLHANSSARAVDRVLDMLPEEVREQMRSVLSVMLKGVLAQRLCKKASGEGRVALVELLMVGYGVANMIRENKVHLIEGYLQSAAGDATGSQGMDSCIFRHVQDGLITAEEGLRYADSADQLRKLLATLPEDR
jgi:twitching motility protein PilT